jgi:segregation and condensation protein A
MDDVFDSVPDTVQLHLDGFEGPLDLLLELARRQKVDLARISITVLVNQYLGAVAGNESLDLMRAADWLVMAAWLTWLKSRLLLPIDAEEAREAEQAQQVLTQRLAELEHVRYVADWIDGQPQLGWDTFERGYVEPTRSFVPVANYMMLLEACVSVLRADMGRPTEVYRPRRVVHWTPHQAMTRIETMLGDLPDGGDLLGFVPKLPAEMADREHAVRVAIASTLTAGLELAREGRVLLLQEALFEPIAVQSAEQATSALQAADQVERPAA